MTNKSIDLDASLREDKIKETRRQGVIPAVLYGKGMENLSLSLDYHNFRRTLKKAGMHSVVNLKIAKGGKSETENVMIHDVTYHPVDDTFMHVDFLKISLKEKVNAKVPIEFIGESGAVKNLGGILSVLLEELNVKALPNKIPDKIEVDISILSDFNTKVKVSDLQVSEDVEVLTDKNIDVVTVMAPRMKDETNEEGTTDATGEGEQDDKSEKAEGGEKEGDKGKDSEKK